MKNKLSKKKLQKMIASDFTDLTVEEIKALIQNEVEKGADKLDTDYIDLCFELLSIKKDDVSDVKRIKFSKPIKIMLVAAVIVTLLVSTITVMAQFGLNLPQRIAHLFDGDAKVDYKLEGLNNTANSYALLESDLAKQLETYGITPVTFPEELIKENCRITKITNMTSDESISKNVSIDFDYKDYHGVLSIAQYFNGFMLGGETTVVDVISGQMKNINGMDVVILEQEDDYCTVRYKDNNTIYEIYLECDLETTIGLVESIK